MRIKITLVFFLFTLVGNAFAQKDVTTFGIQLKPIIPMSIIGFNEETIDANNVDFNLSSQPGFSFGMVARRGFTKMFSVEGGINYTKRNYDLIITDGNFEGKSNFSFLSYDIPLLALIYIQLGENTFLNTAFGASIDFYPSDLETSDDYFRHSTYRKEWVVPSLLANVGFEYRTYKSGYFYIGASYHRPFSNIGQTDVGYYRNKNSNDVLNYDAFADFNLDGSYLTLDLRYFFHEDPERKTKRK
jgi:hypothetical protein